MPYVSNFQDILKLDKVMFIYILSIHSVVLLQNKIVSDLHHSDVDKEKGLLQFLDYLMYVMH